MSKLEETNAMINTAAKIVETGSPMKDIKTIVLCDIAKSLAMIADKLCKTESKKCVKDISGISDTLIVSFDSGLKDESALSVARKCGEKYFMLKLESGEQANILYHLLTEQMTKAKIKKESEE